MTRIHLLIAGEIGPSGQMNTVETDMGISQSMLVPVATILSSSDFTQIKLVFL
jgi:hypothetical protein